MTTAGPNAGRYSRPDGAEQTTLKGPDAATKALDLLAELIDYARYYLQLQTDSIRLSLLSAALWAALGILGTFALIAAVAQSAILVIHGLTSGLDLLLGRRWLSELSIGALVLVLVAASGLVLRKSVLSKQNKSLARYYSNLRREQRERFGKDVRADGQILEGQINGTQPRSGKRAEG